MNGKGNLDSAAVRALVALRPTEDLTDEELRLVDEEMRYSEECRREVEAYGRVVATLQAAGAEPSPTDDRPSLWNRIEPRLGPAGRLKTRRWLPRVATWHLAAACGLLFTAHLFFERLPVLSGRPPLARGGFQLADPLSVAPTTGPDRFIAESVDPIDEEGVIQPRSGILCSAYLGQGGGALIDRLLPDSPAARAGVRRNDVVVAAFLGEERQVIRGPSSLAFVVRRAKAGKPLVLEVVRGDKTHYIPLSGAR
jgi:hypothetical protein